MRIPQIYTHAAKGCDAQGPNNKFCTARFLHVSGVRGGVLVAESVFRSGAIYEQVALHVLHFEHAGHPQRENGQTLRAGASTPSIVGNVAGFGETIPLGGIR
jgi:hypothetical protein